MLDSSQAKFTVGAYIDDFLKATAAGAVPTVDNDIFIPRDDLGFKGDLQKDILSDSSLTNLPFILQSQFSDTFRHERFIHSQFTYGEKNYSLITTSIPTVCEDGSLGVFLLFRKLLIESLQILKMSHRFSVGCTRTG